MAASSSRYTLRAGGMPEAFYECVMFGRTGDLDLSPLETLPRLKLINTGAYRRNRDLHAFPYPRRRSRATRPSGAAPPSVSPAATCNERLVCDGSRRAGSRSGRLGRECRPESFGATADELRERACDRPHTP
jgi:hypothetical protein